MRISDWSSDVCSSDLSHLAGQLANVFAFSVVVNCNGAIRYFGVCHVIFFQHSPVIVKLPPDNKGLEQGSSELDRDAGFPINRSEEHTSELQSLMRISYAVFCLNKQTRERQQDPPSTSMNYIPSIHSTQTHSARNK